MAYRPAQIYTGTGWDDIGDPRVGIQEINTQTANYTLALTDIAKRVQMNNSAARTITIPLNSSVNFPVGTRIDIANINTGVLTVAAASGATVNGRALTLGQWETATLVQRAANTWVLEQHANLTAALGSKLDTSAYTAPGLELITTQSFTTVSSVSINGCFTSTYQNYLVVGTHTQSNTIAVFVRFRASGSDTITNYNRQIFAVEGSVIGGGRNSSIAQIEVAFAGAGDRNDISFTVYRPNEATLTSLACYNGSQAGSASLFMNYGNQTDSTQFDGFTIYPGSGNFTGTIRVYGYRN